MKHRYLKIYRAVGENGTVQMKIGPFDEEPEPGMTDEQKADLASGYKQAFEGEAEQFGAAVLPWSEAEDGDDED